MKRSLSVLCVLLTLTVLVSGLSLAQSTYEYVPKVGVYPDSPGQLWRHYGPVDLTPDTMELLAIDNMLLVDTTAAPGTKHPWWIPGGSEGWVDVDFSTQTVTIELKLRILDQVGSAAFHFGAIDGKSQAGVLFTLDSVGGVQIDATEWHVYRVVIANNEVALFIDDATEASAVWTTTAIDLGSRIVWGDSASGWSGRYELAYLRWSIAH